MEVLQRTANRGSISTGYEVANSVKNEPDNGERFDTGEKFTDYSSVRKFTVSGWFKRTELSVQSVIWFNVNTGTSVTLQFEPGDYLSILFQDNVGNGVESYAKTSALFRDTSAWYHVVLAVDTTDGTAADRTKIYVNGVNQTLAQGNGSYDTFPAQNYDVPLQTRHYLLGYDGSDNGFRGYAAEYYFLDGITASPTDLGEFDEDSGIWKPIEYTGGFGNEGYYLNFEDASALGKDVSSNNQGNFTHYGGSAADQATDTPTNNFCTLNFNTGYIQGSDATTFTQGATTRQGGSSSYNGALGTIGINPFVGSAKWYWEVELSADCDGDGIELGAGWLATSIIQSTTEDKATAGNSAGFQIWTSFNFDPPNEGTGADGDVFGFLLQCDSSNPNLEIYKNDTLFTTRHTATSYDFENDFYFPVVFIYNTGMKAFCNFGNPFDATVSSGNTDPNGYGNFEFDTKSGYALCTKNLAEFG
jgi:hypothetical protein